MANPSPKTTRHRYEEAVVMTDKDITDQVEFGWSDDEYLPVSRCACGHAIEPWDWVISIYRDNAEQCPNCHRRLYFSATVTVYQVVDD